jgi:hypothetical protein
MQKDKQRSTKHTHKTKNRVTGTPLKPGVNSCAPEVYNGEHKTKSREWCIIELYYYG